MITYYLPKFWPVVAICCICGEEHELSHSVGYYCGPTHDEIGSITTEYTDGGVVGGMPACKPCHDKFYNMES